MTIDDVRALVTRISSAVRINGKFRRDGPHYPRLRRWAPSGSNGQPGGSSSCDHAIR